MAIVIRLWVSWLLDLGESALWAVCVNVPLTAAALLKGCRATINALRRVYTVGA